MLHNISRKRKPYIDGLKGVSCLLIFFGHFSAIYKMAESAPSLECFAAKATITYPFSFFFHENFWLYLFFIISGYLLAYNWKGSSPSQVLKKAVMRFFRLAIPVLGAGILILFIQNIWGFCNNRFNEIGTNTWFSSFYSTPIHLKDVFLEPFHVLLFGYSKANVPFWVLREMFLASCIIYICCAVHEQEHGRFPTKTICITGLSLILSLLWHSNIIVTCLIGMCGVWAEAWSARFLDNQPYAVPLALVGVSSPFIIFSLNLLFLKPVAFLLMVISIPRIDFIKKILSAKTPLFLGKISFGIYAIHFPVICSVGFGSLLFLLQYVNGSLAMLTALLISTVFTIAFAVLFHVSVEKITDCICSRLSHSLNN